jgi:hypothetical protein
LINVEIFLGPAGVILGMAAALYVKDRARTAAKEEFLILIKSSLAEFKADFVGSLDDAYVRKGECGLSKSFHDDRIDMHELRLNAIDARLSSMTAHMKGA